MPGQPGDIYRVTTKSLQESLWVREIVFEGTYKELVAKYGTKSQNPLKDFVKHGKKYSYFFSVCRRYYWHGIEDPRPDKWGR